MKNRRTPDQVRALRKPFDRDLASGLTVADACRKHGIREPSYHRWRQRHDPAQADDSRRIRELEATVQRLESLVLELAPEKQMLQELVKKSGDAHPTAGRCGRPGRAKGAKPATGGPAVGLLPEYAPVSTETARR
jgi:putative transposase